jgi:DNA-directed RNA polymerase sigma subunit (sigma70/sigma32)
VLREQSYTLDLEAWVDRILIHQALYNLVAQLPQRQRQIIAARYGLVGAPVRQLDEVGSELGLTGERVRQLQQEALAWMRHPAHSVRLRSLADKNSARDYRQALRQNAALLRKRSGRT